MECMGTLWKNSFTSSGPICTVAVRGRLVDVQFESIHRFLDGDGRLGRLLIAFLLCAAGALREPILYLSLFFKANRQAYYDLLMGVRQTGDWEAWMEFFLTGVREAADQAVNSARRIRELLDSDRREDRDAGDDGNERTAHLPKRADPSNLLGSDGMRKTGISFPP